MRLKYSHRKITMTLTQTTCANRIALRAGKNGARSAEVGDLASVFEKSATKHKQKLFKCKSTIQIYIYIYIYIYIRGSFNKFPDIFFMGTFLRVHTWNSSPLRSKLLRLQCTCCIVPITSGRPHGSPPV